MAKTKINGIEAFKKLANTPVLQAIGKDSEGFFRRISREEFFKVQVKLAKIDENNATVPDLTDEDKKDPIKVKEHAKQVEDTSKSTMKLSCDTVAELMVELMTDEQGNSIFRKEDISTLSNTMSLQFIPEFIEAFMKVQGVTKQEVASAEAEFRG